MRGSPPPACFWLEHLPGTWGNRVVGSPPWPPGEAAGARGCGTVWRAHTVCTYNKPFGFDGLCWFVCVSWAAPVRIEGWAGGGVGRGIQRTSSCTLWYGLISILNMHMFSTKRKTGRRSNVTSPEELPGPPRQRPGKAGSFKEAKNLTATSKLFAQSPASRGVSGPMNKR